MTTTHLSFTRYRHSRFWGVYFRGELLAVTVYKKGAQRLADFFLEVMARLTACRSFRFSPVQLSFKRYKKTRFWAVYHGAELLAVTVYMKGAARLVEFFSALKKIFPAGLAARPCTRVRGYLPRKKTLQRRKLIQGLAFPPVLV